ncbi:DivIVA domain-containing protein [Saccharopolyspora elongata]|uniref:Uncharacterized protein n=1 Tax=Saccharopolyspora elongata TaxID=2530387 RepID=A0A4R4Y8M6_9PSEU|nr:hypothetical protein [Saccharopolyspora elongata]TDD40841.1 hypothetical protein E1288_34405 [Saccharopolyspora elongata]
MRGIRGFFERFRPAGTPGAAARPGVPVDRVAEASAELAPVFALLEDAEVEARQVRANGREESARIRQEARERAEAIVADANARAGAVRADVVAELSGLGGGRACWACSPSRTGCRSSPSWSVPVRCRGENESCCWAAA